jgi:ATP-binding protein involved in chromosome partitioning
MSYNPIMSQLNENVVLDALRQIKDPDLHKDIVTLGFIRDLAINNGNVSFRIVLTTPACPVKSEMESAARELVGAIPGVQSVNVTMDAEVPKGAASPTKSLCPVSKTSSRFPREKAGSANRRWRLISPLR